MKFITLLSILPIVFLLANCSSTPAKRIEQNPAIYSSLSSKNKQLVSEGKIAQGMSKKAVFLALGRADSESTGVKKGKRYDRWDYNVLVPVYSHSFHPYYGYGRGYWRRGYYGGFGYAPTVHYVPRRGSSVHFINSRVVGWSHVRRNR